LPAVKLMPKYKNSLAILIFSLILFSLSNTRLKLSLLKKKGGNKHEDLCLLLSPLIIIQKTGLYQ
jgi:hypothetical protein